MCETFKTVNKKFPYDIVGVTKENWRAKVAQVVKYCRMDCMALHEGYISFIKQRATTYYNNTGFPK